MSDSAAGLPRFDSFEEYWAVRNEPSLWLPAFRRVLVAAGLPSSGSVDMLVPSQYPTALARDLDAVVTIYPDQWNGPASYRLEVEAHQVLAGSGLPVPELIAHGTFPTGGAEPDWAWLVETKASGQPWSRVADAMPSDRREDAAAELGATLRRWHAVPHAGRQGSGGHLGSGWGIFAELIRDELEHLGKQDERLACFPPALRPWLRGLAESTFAEVDVGAPTSLLHGDLHGENVLVDPDSGVVTGIIDLNEMYAGHPWYDLADTCFRLLYGESGCVHTFLTGYGIDLGHESDGDPAAQAGRVALRLLGWALLHDFDVLTETCRRRGVPHLESMHTASDNALTELAGHLTGLHPLGGRRLDGR